MTWPIDVIILYVSIQWGEDSVNRKPVYLIKDKAENVWEKNTSIISLVLDSNKEELK